MTNIQKETRLTLKEKLEFLKEAGYTYIPDTGEVLRSGVRSGGQKKEGYVALQFTIKKQHYSVYAHQFAWYMHYGLVPGYIDHENHIRNDNRILNLLDGTPRSNNFNRSNVKGYFWSEQKQKWKSEILIYDKKIHLGFFDCETDSRNAYLDAKTFFHVAPSRPEEKNKVLMLEREGLFDKIKEYQFLKGLIKGYFWNKQFNRWHVRINVNKKQIHIGFYEKEQDARSAYIVAKKTYYLISSQSQL